MSTTTTVPVTHHNNGSVEGLEPGQFVYVVAARLTEPRSCDPVGTILEVVNDETEWVVAVELTDVEGNPFSVITFPECVLPVH